MKSLKFLFLVALACVVLFSGCADSGSEFKPIVNDVVHLVHGTRSYPSRIWIKGKCIVWSVKSNELAESHRLVEKEIKASPSDEEITIFFVVEIEKVYMGTYSVSNQPGYRKEAAICVVYWPEKEEVGWYTVKGSMPPSSRTVVYSSSSGTINGPIADWINSLPRM